MTAEQQSTGEGQDQGGEQGRLGQLEQPEQVAPDLGQQAGQEQEQPAPAERREGKPWDRPEGEGQPWQRNDER